MYTLRFYIIYHVQGGGVHQGSVNILCTGGCVYTKVRYNILCTVQDDVCTPIGSINILCTGGCVFTKVLYNILCTWGYYTPRCNEIYYVQADVCPHPRFIREHLCTGCSTVDEALKFSG